MLRVGFVVPALELSVYVVRIPQELSVILIGLITAGVCVNHVGNATRRPQIQLGPNVIRTVHILVVVAVGNVCDVIES